MIFILAPINITDNSFGGIRNKYFEFALNHKVLSLSTIYFKHASLFNLISPDSARTTAYPAATPVFQMLFACSFLQFSVEGTMKHGLKKGFQALPAGRLRGFHLADCCGQDATNGTGNSAAATCCGSVAFCVASR